MTKKEEVKKEYENSSLTLAQLAEKHDVSLNTIKAWKSRDKKKDIIWNREKKKDAAKKKKVAEKVAEVAIEVAEIEITEKQEKLCYEYIKGKSKSDAYRAAYNCEGMTSKTINEKACKVFKDEKVRARVKSLRAINIGNVVRERKDLLDKLYLSLEICMGVKPSKSTVMNILEDGSEAKVLDQKLYKVELKSIAPIATQISKLEGWDVNKVEHSGDVGITIVDNIPSE